jgi:hypothetical protein
VSWTVGKWNSAEHNYEMLNPLKSKVKMSQDHSKTMLIIIELSFLFQMSSKKLKVDINSTLKNRINKINMLSGEDRTPMMS